MAIFDKAWYNMNKELDFLRRLIENWRTLADEKAVGIMDKLAIDADYNRAVEILNKVKRENSVSTDRQHKATSG